MFTGPTFFPIYENRLVPLSLATTRRAPKFFSKTTFVAQRPPPKIQTLETTQDILVFLRL